MRKVLSLLFLLCFPLALSAIWYGDGSSPANAYYGVIDGASPMRTWNLTNYPGGVIYIGRSTSGQEDLQIGTGGTLSIAEGITVKFCTSSSDLRITGTGVLNAAGSSTNYITFTRDIQPTWGHISFEASTGISLIQYCIIEYGSKTGDLIEGYGGGIHANTSRLTISYCTIQNNTALWGGGIFVNKYRNPTINNCIIRNNTANSGGGGLYFWDNSYSVVTNCLIYGNSSINTTSYGGGGIFIGPASGAVKVINCTLAKNTAGFRANEIYFLSSPNARIINTILWGSNTPYLGATSSSFMNCAIQGGYPTGSTGCVNLNSDNLNVAGPNFAATDGSDWSINFISPCRDAGTIPSPVVPADFIGSSRVGPYDIGAYEVQYSRWKTTATSTDWATAANWESGVPTSSQDVIIPTGATNYPTGSSSQDFTIGAGKLMLLNPGAQVTLGVLTNGGTLRLESDSLRISSLICSSYSGNNAEVQLYLKGGTGTYGPNWHYISSPFTSLNVSAFTSTTMDLAQWVENLASANLLYGWVAYDGYFYRIDVNPPYTGPTFSQLAPGKGYNHYFSLTHLYSLQGQLNTSDAVSGLSYTVITPDAPTRYGLNLLGNPFSSGLDWDQIANDPGYPANTSKAIYFNKSGTYVYYVNGVGSEAGVTGIIPPMQGFFTKTYSGGHSITLPASARVNGSIPARYKGASVVPLVRLNLTSGNYTDNTVVRFDNAAKSGQDLDFDAPKLFINNTYPYIYSVSEGTKFAINGLPFPETLTEIPIVVNITSAGNHTLSAIEFQGLDNFQVTLADKVTGFEANIKTTRYFPFTASPGLLADRFTLKIGNNPTGIEDPVSPTGIFNIYAASGYINIQTIADEWDGKSGSIRVLDLTGKVVSNSDNNYFSKNSMISFPARLPSGIYMVEIRTGTKRFVGKVMVK